MLSVPPSIWWIDDKTTSPVTPKENVAAVRRESAALAEAARKSLKPIVPSCPEWSVSDLVWHVGGIHHLLLMLWRRLPLNAVEVLGDRGVAEAFVGGMDLG